MSGSSSSTVKYGFRQGVEVTRTGEKRGEEIKKGDGEREGREDAASLPHIYNPSAATVNVNRSHLLLL